VGKYLLFGRAGQQMGGMFKRPAGMTESWPSWLLYASVPSAGKAADAAKAAGGRVVNGPMQVPGGGWIAQLVDPQGAAIAVHQMPAAAPAAPKPKRAAKPEAAVTAAPKPAAAGTAPASARPSRVAKTKRRAPAKKAKKAVVKKAVKAKSKSKSAKRAAPARAKKAKKKAAKRSTAGKKKSRAAKRKR
jgi:hypothetical protein